MTEDNNKTLLYTIGAGLAVALLWLLAPLISALGKTGTAVADAVTEGVEFLKDAGSLAKDVATGVNFEEYGPWEYLVRFATYSIQYNPAGYLLVLEYIPDMRGHFKPGDNIFLYLKKHDDGASTATVVWRIGVNGSAHESQMEWRKLWWAWPIRHAGEPSTRVVALDWTKVPWTIPWPIYDGMANAVPDPTAVRKLLYAFGAPGSGIHWGHGTAQYAGPVPPPVLPADLSEWERRAVTAIAIT